MTFFSRVRLFLFFLLGMFSSFIYAQSDELEADSQRFKDQDHVPKAGFDFSGYMRGGVSGNAYGEATQTPGDDGKNQFTVDGGYSQARLGNESNYGEYAFLYSGLGESMWYTTTFRLALDDPDFSKGWKSAASTPGNLILAEAYLRLGWYDNKATVWAGNRYNDSVGIELYDYYINDLSNAYGGGVDNWAIGNSQWDFAYMISYDYAEGASDGSNSTLNSIVVSPTVPLGAGDLTLKIVPSVAITDAGNKNGAVTEALYSMNNIGGSENNNISFFGYYTFGTGVYTVEYNDAIADQDNSTYRTGGGTQMGFQVSDNVGIKAVTMVEARGNYADAKTNGIWTTAAIRPFISVYENIGLMLEYDFDYFVYADDDTSANVQNRVTIAPTLTLDSKASIFSDPLLYVFASYARGEFANTTSNSTLLHDDSKQGFKYGIAFSLGW